MNRIALTKTGRVRPQHAETLFMLNCYDVWSATVLGPCCQPDAQEQEEARDRERACH